MARLAAAGLVVMLPMAVTSPQGESRVTRFDLLRLNRNTQDNMKDKLTEEQKRKLREILRYHIIIPKNEDNKDTQGLSVHKRGNGCNQG